LLSILCDFDGTIAEHDLAEMVLKKFGRRGWELYDELLADGKITVEECVASQYAMIDVRSHKQILDYVDDFCRIREGFEELLSKDRREGVILMIVSAGLDFCIRHAFRKSGLELPSIVCAKSELNPGHGFRLAFPGRHYEAARDFKDDVVMYRRGMGDTVVYVGDGRGDLNAAGRSDVVFAIGGSSLERLCGKRAIPHRAIRTFGPVLDFVDSGAWQKEGPSQRRPRRPNASA
jgi:2-hydroxy-3-keto-5-methylthiopentenyl-1-phosphate phosphatase